jgi:hypothetical protein
MGLVGKPIEFSAHTLTHRFNNRSQNFKLEESRKKKIDVTVVNSVQNAATNTSYEPMYLRHQAISYTIITYIQMAFNIIISVTILYVFTKIILVVKQDFRLKAQEYVDGRPIIEYVSIYD